jgi:hypothetical protein
MAELSIELPREDIQAEGEIETRAKHGLQAAKQSVLIA